MTKKNKQIIGTTYSFPIKFKTGHGGPGLDSSYPLGLALSGGGHRASLFGLGVLMAMRDAGKQPIQISSVSGGSITNAFLAYNYFAKTSKEESKDETLWHQETLRLFETIVNKGVVTKAWMVFLLAFLILPPVVFVAMALLRMLPIWYVTVPIAIAWATILLLRGLLIEWLISRRYFGGFFKGVGLSQLHNSNCEDPIEHVICCTDLVTGRPLYVSTRDGGHIFRRFNDRPAGIGPRTTMPAEEAREIKNLGVSYRASTLSAAAAVRASAGFPGIPPRRFRLNRFELDPCDEDKARVLPPLAFLSDGGIWNNLATQPYEDGFLWGDYGPWVVVVADASAPLDYMTAFQFHLPGIAEFRALGRQAVIQNINTVGPRRVNYHDWIRRELSSHRSARFASERLYPLVSCMETPEQIKARLMAAITKEDFNDEFLVDSEKNRRAERREKTRKRAVYLERDADEPKPAAEETQVDPHAAWNFRRLSNLAMVDGKGRDVSNRDPVASCPTTLGKIDRATAIAIVGRGYANTAIMLYLTGLVDELVFPKGWLGRATRCYN